MSYGDQNSFEDSIIFDEGPTTLVQRLKYVKRLVFSVTKLEFRLLWNKIFQKEDEELGWLLNPYKQGNSRVDATMMSSFRNGDSAGYQYGFDDVSAALGSERVTIHSKGVARRGNTKRRKHEDKRTLGEKALDIARYMGMGVYMTSTSFPSPFLPINDTMLYEENGYGQYYTYTMSKIW